MLSTYQLKDISADTKARLLLRNTDDGGQIEDSVKQIIQKVAQKGDKALLELTEQLDGVKLEKLFVEVTEISALAAQVNENERNALITAYQNIERFHQQQLVKETKVETTKGVTCWRENRAIEKVGLYVPGGSAVLPSSFLMLGIPAKIAGCKEIVVCTPPQKNGKINPYVAFVATLLGIQKIYLLGGAQAVAAMALGTESIPKVSKIFGPGNQYVTKAKVLAQSMFGTAMDMPAGPSEVLILADKSANAKFIASDMLAQCEHGADSQAVLLSTSAELVEKVNIELKTQLEKLPRKEIASKALIISYAILTENMGDLIEFSNEYAPEHLIIASDDWENISPKIINAGSVFLGNHTPEAAGDYASGTNHTLPTSGFAKAYSGVSVDSFIKKITFQHISKEGINNLGPTVEILANLENLHGHKNSITVRLEE